ncbi:MAG: right-handed parallel beta-helix repeat-containing protein [Euryarchaeota archaeon]|nr:right-handed parallel beta-helix repeat-containing protein [Euryarchaeota archaeon]
MMIKIVALGIICLFVGTSTIPALNAKPDQTSTKKTNTAPGEEMDVVDMKSMDGIGVNKFITPALIDGKPYSNTGEIGQGNLPPGFEARPFDQNINDEGLSLPSFISNSDELPVFVGEKLTPESTEDDIGANKFITPTLISGKPYGDTGEKLTPEQEYLLQGITKEVTNQDVGDGTFEKISLGDGDSKDYGGPYDSDYFLHISDVHWGPGFSGENGYINWNRFVNGDILQWDADDLPEFILCTGDIVEYGAGSAGALLWEYLFENPDGPLYGDSSGNWLVSLKLAQGGEQRVPIFFCPGNHDFRYIYQVPSGDNPYGYLDWVRKTLNPAELNYMATPAPNVKLFSMNSGFDDVLPPPWLGTCVALPEGDGFTLAQISWLDEKLDMLDGKRDYRDTSGNYKIVMFHHPYLNKFGRDIFCGDGWGTNPRDGTFLYYRDEFIDLCHRYNIDLACWGHTHNDAFTGIIPGTSTRYSDGGSLRDSSRKYNIFSLNPPLPPLPPPKVSVIQIPSLGKSTTPEIIVLFSYEDNNDLAILDSSSNLVCFGKLNKSEYCYIPLNPGVYTIEGHKKFSVLTGTSYSHDWGGRGFYAVDGNGRGASTELFTYMLSASDPQRIEQFIVFAYTNGTNINITDMTTNKIVWSGSLDKSNHYNTTAVCGHVVKVESNYPVSALSYAGQGYYVPSANRKFSGTEFYTYAHAYIDSDWYYGDVLHVFAYENDTQVTITDSETGYKYWNGTLGATNPESHYIAPRYYDGTPRYYTILSDKVITVGVLPLDYNVSDGYTVAHYGSYVPDKTGKRIGTEFNALLFPYCEGYATGWYMFTVYEDGTTVGEGGIPELTNLDKGTYYFANLPPPFGWGVAVVFNIESNKPISIYSFFGPPQLGVSFAPVLSDSDSEYDIFVDVDNVDEPWLGTQTYPYKSIQQGVDSAVDGDVIFVAKGTYSEDVTIDKSITIQGEEKETTIIDGGGNGAVITIRSINGVKVSGFTVRNGDNGIYVWGCQNIKISDNIITENSVLAIFLSVTSNSNISQNTINDNLNGILLKFMSSGNRIYENTIQGNDEFGINIEYSPGESDAYNYIYHNNFIRNGHSARDDSVNLWYDNQSSGGNYWDDFDEPEEGAYDDDGNGLADIPYRILGGDNQDLYPFINPDGWTTIYVNNSALPGWYDHSHVRTIQEGINNASDFVETVYVYPGTYNEQIVVNKTLILEGQSKDTVIINGGTWTSGAMVTITCDNVILKNFTIKNDNNYGIEVRSNYNTIMDNNITQATCYPVNGIHLKTSFFNTIIRNTITQSDKGILLDDSTENIFRGNTIISCLDGFVFENEEGLNNDVDQSNTVNGHHLLVLNNVQTPTIIDGTNLDMEYTLGGACATNYGVINLYKCSNVVIRNCTISNGEYGIYFYESSNNIIEKCTVCNAIGICLNSGSSNNVISDTNSSNNLKGIFLQSHSDYNIIKNNKCTDNYYIGIYLENYCNNNLIENNNCSNNYGEGIFLQERSCYNQIKNNIIIGGGNGYSGILLAYGLNLESLHPASNNLIENNTCIGWSYYGISIASDNNIIRNNNCSYNELGISVGGYANKVFHNIFIGNDNPSSIDEGNWLNNTYPSGGNYWDDYTSLYPTATDCEGDGIWNTPYRAVGGGGYPDFYPYVQPNGWMIPPTTSFMYSSPDLDFNFTQFNDTSIDPNGVIMSWYWDFGDGNTSNEQNPIHWYMENGTYDVTLTVTDDDGAVSSTPQTITIPTGSGVAPNHPPYMPNTPSPSYYAEDVPGSIDLSWTGGDPDNDTVTYTVYFGEFDDSSPCLIPLVSSQDTTMYNTGALYYASTYYWKIIATDNHGDSTSGPFWYFNTTAHPPKIPHSPYPADHSTDVYTYADLSWSGGDLGDVDEVSYDVYFGTTNPPPKIHSNWTMTDYALGLMSYSTRYYWYVVAWDTHGASAKGPPWDLSWEFTTRHNPAEPEHEHNITCFLAGTPITMADGSSKNIETISIGDHVISYDTEKQMLTTGVVIQTFVHENSNNGYLEINNLRVTPNHPLWINEEWKEAGEAHLGDHLLRLDGTKEIITHIRYIPGTYTVYNLEVEQDHTYFAHGVLVHNKAPLTEEQYLHLFSDHGGISTG